MKIQVTDAIKKKIFIALLTAGVSSPVAYVATTHTVDSEGFLTHLHNDPVGLPTVCIGHLAKKGEVVKQEYTIDECIAIYVKDWTEHEKALNKLVKVDYKSEWMKGALTDFTFNKGIGNVSSSTMLKDLNAKRYEKACTELTRWVYGKVNGVAVKLPGLVIRASKQYDYCMGKEPANYEQDIQRWLN